MRFDLGRPSSSITIKSRVPEGVRFNPIGHVLEMACEGKQRKYANVEQMFGSNEENVISIGLHAECFPAFLFCFYCFQNFCTWKFHEPQLGINKKC